MLRNVLVLGLFATLAVSAAGCCVDACGTRRGPLGRPLPGPIDCECAGFGCGACGMGPIRYAGYRATCGAGCGELYLDEWASDPPDCVEPCDDGWCAPCYTGCRRPFPVFGWGGLWGRRYWPGRSYGSGPAMYDGGTVIHEGAVFEGGQPAPSAAPTPAARQTQSALRRPATAQQPYYDQAPQHPQAQHRMPAGYRSAAGHAHPVSQRVYR